MPSYLKDKQLGVTGGAVAKGDGKISAGSILGGDKTTGVTGGVVAKGGGKYQR